MNTVISRFPGRLLLTGALALSVLVAGTGGSLLAARAPADVAAATTPVAPAAINANLQGRLLLVLPFEDHSGEPNLAWISEAAPAVLNRRLSAAGFMPISRDDRLYALEHLGLPPDFRPSRAGTIRLAQNLDADYVVLGSFSTSGGRFQTTARILNMHTLHLSEPIEEEADLSQLLSVLNSLSWKVARQLEPGFAVAEQTFLAADSNLKIGAFEHYIRGLVESGSDAQIPHLKEAVALDPSFSPARMALGMAYFANQQYDLAAITLGRLPKDDANAREADFYRGLAYLYIGNYIKAEDAFAFVSRQLPLPEVVNNQGVAVSRRGKDATALFLQAVIADPHDPDYQFNLAVALSRKNDLPGAIRAIEQSLKLRPQDSEAKGFAAALRERQRLKASGQAAPQPSAPKPQPVVVADRGDPIPDPQPDPADAEDATPLERVKRTFNEASFRQAASELEQMDALRLASLPPEKHAAALTEEGTRFLHQGLMLEAEREFQAALQISAGDAAAHAGLAMVRERGGDTAAAREEAHQSLSLQPNAAAYLVLARLDLAASQLAAAADNLSHALQLEPQNAAARGLRQQLEAKGQRLP